MRIAVALFAPLLALGCAGARGEPARAGAMVNATAAVGAGARSDDERAIDAMAAVHGGAGPWVVAGYRMGQFAVARLGLDRGSFDVEVTHFTPKEVQYSCIADGAAAATGASLGKLNLALTEAPPAEMRTVYRRRSTGQTLTLRVTSAFRQRFLAVPRERLAEAGREVLRLRDHEIFEIVP